MTVSSALNRKEYAGNGVTVAFATSPVVFFETSELEVYDVVTATGVATLKTETTDYTVSGGDGSTGTVTMLVAPAAAHTLVIVRTLPITQATDFVNNDASDAEVAEDALDRLTMVDQQLQAQLDRAFKLADSDTSSVSTTLPDATTRALKIIGFDADGNVALYDESSAVSATANVQNTYDAVSAVALNLHEYIEDDGSYNVMGFMPQNLKAAIRNASTVTDVSAYAQAAITAGMLEHHHVLFPRGRYVAPGLTANSYTGTGFGIRGEGAVIRLGANEVGLTISGSSDISVRGLRFDATAASGASQAGILSTGSKRVKIIDNYFGLLTYGIRNAAAGTGLATAAGIPVPSLMALNTIKACTSGIWFETTGEYVTAIANIITDCTTQGILEDAGNITIANNQINGNAIGIRVRGNVASNPDHGSIIGNSLNHNSSAGLWIHDLTYSYRIANNNIWANIYSNLGSIGTSVGVYMATVKNVNFTGNVLGNNIVNLGIDGMTNSQVTGNTFIADPAGTTFNIKEFSALTVANGNRMAPNTFQGALLASANNNDYEQTYTIGTTGAPAFENSAANLGSGFTPAAYHKDADGVVHLRGVIVVATNTTAFTLPANFRPATKYIQAVVSNNLISAAQVTSGGLVTFTFGSSATWASLDGMSFRAEA